MIKSLIKKNSPQYMLDFMRACYWGMRSLGAYGGPFVFFLKKQGVVYVYKKE